MDSVISSVNPANQGNITADKVVSGTIENPPVQIKDIRPTDSLLLKILVSEDSSLSGNLEVSINGEKVDVPVKITIEGKLELPEDRQNQAIVRFSGTNNAYVRILKINGENPENYVVKGMNRDLPGNLPLILETGNAVKNISLHSLDMGTLVEKVLQKANLPENIAASLQDGLSGGYLRISVSGIIAGITNDVLGNLNAPLDNAMERVRLIVKNFAENGDMDLKETLAQIKAELLPLKNIQLAGTVLNGNDGSLLAIKTPLGNILADISGEVVKINGDDGVLLEITDIVQAKENDAENLAEQLLPTAQTTSRQVAGKEPLLRLLEYLNGNELKELGDDLRGKIPSANEKMLANMVNFMKGALNKNPEQWLGKDLLHKLDSAGTNGAETAAKLNDFMQMSVREAGGWRQVEIPFLNGDELNKIRVAVKKTEDDSEEKTSAEKKAKGTRFVVDTSFSKLGSFQFDGFAVAKEKRFDLVLRTENEIGEDFFAEIYRLFKTTLHEFDYYGGLKLHVKEKFIKVCEDTPITNTINTGIYI